MISEGRKQKELFSFHILLRNIFFIVKIKHRSDSFMVQDFIINDNYHIINQVYQRN